MYIIQNVPHAHFALKSNNDYKNITLLCHKRTYIISLRKETSKKTNMAVTWNDGALLHRSPVQQATFRSLPREERLVPNAEASTLFPSSLQSLGMAAENATAAAASPLVAETVGGVSQVRTTDTTLLFFPLKTCNSISEMYI